MNFTLLYAARSVLYPLRQTPNLLAYALRVLEVRLMDAETPTQALEVFAGLEVLSLEALMAELREPFSPKAWRYLNQHGCVLCELAATPASLEQLPLAADLLAESGLDPQAQRWVVMHLFTRLDGLTPAIRGRAVAFLRALARDKAGDYATETLQDLTDFVFTVDETLDRHQRVAPLQWWVQASRDWHRQAQWKANTQGEWGSALAGFEQAPYKAIGLVHSQDLNQESDSMHHCIASYAQRCQSGEYRVFRVLEKETPVATVGLVRVGERFALEQIRGPHNAQVNAQLQKLARDLSTAYNQALGFKDEMREVEYGRLERARRLRVIAQADGGYLVQGGSQPHRVFDGWCDCMDFVMGHLCKHLLAVGLLERPHLRPGDQLAINRHHEQ